MSNVPLSFFPLRVSKLLSTPFRGVGETLQKGFPHYEFVLKQTDLYIDCDEFFSIAFMNALIWGLLLSGVMTIVFNILKVGNPPVMGLIVGAMLGVMVFVRIVFGLKVIINKKVKSIDSNLVFGLKMMLVEINASVSLFDSIVMVASYKLGEMSSVFKEIAKRLSAGEREQEVFRDVAAKNPSPFLKKTLWQLVSGLKVGSPIGKVIEESLNSLEREQKNEIIAYGSSLRVLTLLFLMLGVIIPAMGLAFLIVINSLPSMGINKLAPWALIGGVALFELLLLGLIKSKRPNLMGSV